MTSSSRSSRASVRSPGAPLKASARAADQDDLALLERLAHDLKSNSAMIGLQTLSEAAAAIELASRERRSEDARAGVDRLESLVADALAALL